MPTFQSENIEIAFEVYGDGVPVVLVHGFASNGAVNWLETGWVEVLTDKGYQAITIDNRGHGKSEKIYDSEFYSAKAMARDVANLVNHLGLGSAVVMGYSMGARISAFAAVNTPDKVRAAVFGGLGINMVLGLTSSEIIISGLLAPTLAEITDKTARQFRVFAEHTGSDLKALAACMAASRIRISESDMNTIKVPALVAVGGHDEIGGAPEPLAALMDKGESLVIPNRGHMRATGDQAFKDGVVEFLQRHKAFIEQA